MSGSIVGRFMAAMLVSVVSQSPSAGKNDVDWPHYASTLSSTKYSKTSQITLENASALKQRWTWDSPDNCDAQLGGEPVRADESALKYRVGPFESTPIKVNEKLYVSTSLGRVVALDPATGEQLWQWDGQVYDTFKTDGTITHYPPNIGYVHRGVSYWQSTDSAQKFIVTGTLDGRLVWLDADTGRLAREVDLTLGLGRAVSNRNYAVTSPPAVCQDTIIVGSSMRDLTEKGATPPGHVRGYDAATGALRWTFHTIPANEQSEGADTWQDSSWRDAGNTNVWTWISASAANGVAYLATGTPNRDLYGGLRPGDNLFAESIVALDCRDGTKKWHQQLVRHGVWDYDLPAPPIRVRDRLFQVSKQAFLYVFDADTGTSVWPLHEWNVPRSSSEQLSKTQVIPDWPHAFDKQGVLVPDDLLDWTPGLARWARDTLMQGAGDTLPAGGALFTPPGVMAPDGDGAIVQMPGYRGGASWAGAAYHEPSSLLLVPSVSRPDLAALSKVGEPSRYVRKLRLSISPFVLKPSPFYGRITAYDTYSGAIRWVIPVGAGPLEELKALTVAHSAGSLTETSAERIVLGKIDELLRSVNVSPHASRHLGWPRRTHVFTTSTALFAVQEGEVRLDGVHVPQSGEGEGEVTTLFFKLSGAEPTLLVIDPESGRIHARIALSAGVYGAPMTYVHDGSQYIVLPFGGAQQPAGLQAFALH